MAKEDLLMTEAPIAAQEKNLHEDVAADEIETAHPGYLGSQSACDVGSLKGVGRICRQACVDTYSKAAFAKHKGTKTPITVAACYYIH